LRTGGYRHRASARVTRNPGITCVRLRIVWRRSGMKVGSA